MFECTCGRPGCTIGQLDRKIVTDKPVEVVFPPGHLLKSTATMTDSEAEKLTQKWRQRYAGPYVPIILDINFNLLKGDYYGFHKP